MINATRPHFTTIKISVKSLRRKPSVTITAICQGANHTTKGLIHCDGCALVVRLKTGFTGLLFFKTCTIIKLHINGANDCFLLVAGCERASIDPSMREKFN